MSENKDPKSKRLRILTAVLIALAVGAAGFAGYAAAGGPSEEDGTEASEQPEDGEVVELGQLTVSLGGAEGHYARVGLAVVLAEGVAEEDVTGRFPLLKDAALLAVADLEPDDLRSRAGLEELRESLTDVAHEIYEDDRVLRVILVEAIVT